MSFRSKMKNAGLAVVATLPLLGHAGYLASMVWHERAHTVAAREIPAVNYGDGIVRSGDFRIARYDDGSVIAGRHGLTKYKFTDANGDGRAETLSTGMISRVGMYMNSRAPTAEEQAEYQRLYKQL